jgi:hypothetical protein
MSSGALICVVALVIVNVALQPVADRKGLGQSLSWLRIGAIIAGIAMYIALR